MRVTVEYEGQVYGARFEDDASAILIGNSVRNTIQRLREELGELPLLTPEETR